MNIFSRKERRELWFFLLLGIIGALFFALFFKSVSPAASLRFQVSRSQAKVQGETFLKSVGLNPRSYHCAITFQSDDDEAVYVQKTLGSQGSSRFFENELAPWYWKIRWFRPLKEEEMAIALSPNGKVVGFRHTISEESGGAFIPKEEATQLAAAFIEKQVGLSLADWKLISSQQEDKKQRRDQLFIWEKRGIHVGHGGLQMSCGVQGASVNSFSLYIQIPESFTQRSEQTNANRNLLTRIFSLFYVALGVFVGGEFLLSLKQHNFRWKIPLLLAIGMFSLSLLSDLNSLPLQIASLDTRESLSHFVLSQIISGSLKAFWSALFILMVAVGADNLQRATWPQKERLVHVFTGAYFRSKNFIRCAAVGYALGALQLGYVAAYYLITRRFFGGWSPMESPYYNVASSTLPWVFPLTIGITAALNEELFFRMFSISLLKRLLKWIVPAVVIPAVVWGFLHSNYYVEPIYNRGVELGIVGLALGLVYLRFGIVPVVLCHYTYNSVLGFIPLLRSESLFFKTSGWISLFWIVLPGIVALLSYVRLKRRRLSGEFVLPPEEEVKPRPLGQSALFRLGRRLGFEFFGVPSAWKPEGKGAHPMEKSALGKPAFFSLVGIGLVSLFLMFRFFPAHYGPAPHGGVGKEKAVQIAGVFLKESGIENPFSKPLRVFFRESHASVGTYLLRAFGMEKANRVAAQEGVSFLRWGVVFYQLGDPNRLTVSIDAGGKVVGFQIARGEENSVGGALTPDEAKLQAEQLLQRQRPGDWKSFRYAGAKTARLKSRSDYSFVWEKQIDSAPELVFRILITVHGKELGGYEENITPPEHFVRGLKEKRGLDTAIMLFVALIVVVGSAWVALDAVFKFRLGLYNWGLAFRLGLVFLLCDVAGKINSWQDILVSLVEANPLNPSVFLWEKVLNLVLGQLTTFGFIVFFSAFSLALIREKFGAFSFSSFLAPREWGRKENVQGGVLALLAFLVMWCGEHFLMALELQLVPQTVKASYPFLKTTPVNSWLPAVGMLTSAVKDSLLFSLTLGGVIAFFWKIFRRPVYLVLFVAVTSSLQYVSSQFTWGEMALKITLHLAVVLFLLWGLQRFIRCNLFFYLYFFWIRSLFPHLQLIRFSDPSLSAQGWFALFLLLLPLLLVLLSSLRVRPRVSA